MGALSSFLVPSNLDLWRSGDEDGVSQIGTKALWILGSELDDGGVRDDSLPLSLLELLGGVTWSVDGGGRAGAVGT